MDLFAPPNLEDLKTRKLEFRQIQIKEHHKDKLEVLFKMFECRLRGYHRWTAVYYSSSTVELSLAHLNHYLNIRKEYRNTQEPETPLYTHCVDCNILQISENLYSHAFLEYLLHSIAARPKGI